MVLHQVVRLYFSPEILGLDLNRADLLLELPELIVGEIANLLENRQNKISDRLLVFQLLIKLPVKTDETQLVPNPVQKLLIDDGLIQKINIFLQIETELLNRKNVCADTLDKIGVSGFFHLTKMVAAHASPSFPGVFSAAKVITASQRLPEAG